MKQLLLKRVLRKGMGSLYPVARKWFRAVFPALRDQSFYVEQLRGKKALEVGGPSDVFRDPAFLPVYAALQSVDGCNFGENTVWEGTLQEGQRYTFLADRPPGYQYILEGSDLGPIQSESYEVLLSSHSLEHVANPLKALGEWRRVLKPEGMLLLILPHKDGTFDHRRPVTQLSHLIEDYEKSTGEDDLTHLDEIIRLHDLSQDRAAGDLETFRKRSLQNGQNRCLHHHVFDSLSAVRLVDHAGWQILRADVAQPHHIVMFCRKADRPDNSAFVDPRSSLLQNSPFPSDRVSASVR